MPPNLVRNSIAANAGVDQVEGVSNNVKLIEGHSRVAELSSTRCSARGSRTFGMALRSNDPHDPHA
jgi:hypothetical protein